MSGVSGQKPRLTKQGKKIFMQDRKFRTSCCPWIVVKILVPVRPLHRHRNTRQVHLQVQQQSEVTNRQQETGAIHQKLGALPVERVCKNSQFQQATECSRQHISPTTSVTACLQDNTNHKGLALCLDATPGHQGTSVGPSQRPRCTGARKERPWVAKMHHTRLQAGNKTRTHSHKDGARLSITCKWRDHR